MAIDSHAELVKRLRRGENEAAREIVARFAHRLIALARVRLDPDLRAREDPEDVVQSVLRSFFTRCTHGEFSLEDEESLWTILTVITIRKCLNRREYHRAARRDLYREIALSELERSWAKFEILAREPAPEEAAMLTETLERLMNLLEPRDRMVLTLHLEGCSFSEISQRIGRTERTVRRTLELIAKRLARLSDEEESPAAGPGVGPRAAELPGRREESG